MRWYLRAIQRTPRQDSDDLARRVDTQRAKLVGLSLVGRAGLLSEDLCCTDQRAVVALCEGHDASVWLSAMVLAAGTCRPLLVIHDPEELSSVRRDSGWTLIARTRLLPGDNDLFAGFQDVIDAATSEELADGVLELMQRERSRSA
jgi:hypothetical protein